MTPTYLHFNEKYNKEQGYYIVLDGSDLVREYTKFWRYRERKRIDIFMLSNKLVIRYLKPFKRTWKKGNYNEFQFNIVNVGYKDKTTHLPEGKIFQLERLTN